MKKLAAFFPAFALLLLGRKVVAIPATPAKKLPFSNAYWFEHLKKETLRFHIPLQIALSQIQQESSGNQSALGSAGEIGLFQIKQAVVKDYKEITRDLSTIDLKDPFDNITVGLWYLSHLRDHWNLSISDALLAYNSGIGNFLNGKIQNINYANVIINRAEGFPIA